MYRIKFTSCAIFAFAPLFAGAEPALDLERESAQMVPLFEALPVNECMVTAMVHRQRDGLIIGATCGKKEICLFSFDPSSTVVKKLDCFEALWWDEPRLALGPEGDIYLGARRAYDKQFFFERPRQRPHTPGTFRRRDSVPPPHLMDSTAPSMPLRHYSPEGRLLKEIVLPEFPEPDGVGALAVDATGQMLCGLTAPGGRLFTVALSSGLQKDYGEVVPLPQHHHTRPISRVLLAADNGKIYLSGTSTGASNDDDMGHILELDPRTGVLKPLDARLPAVVGRRRFAAIDAAVKQDDGSFLAGTTDGYLFRFDPKTALVEGFGKPLRQHRILGLARGADGLIYGGGGEEGGLPRLFAFDPVLRRMHLGTWPGGMQPEGGHQTFGDIGAVVSTADGTLICGERERRGYLLLYYPQDRPMSSAAETKTRYTAASATSSKWKSTLAGEALANCTRDRFIDFSAASGTLGLAPTYLIADAMARSSKISEPLTDAIQVKKIFELPSAVEKAEILFFGGGGSEQNPMLITVNGNEIRHVQDRKKMLTGGWDRETIPGHFLQQGSNELIFSGAGFLLIDADRPGKNSFKRLSGESSEWKSDILGPENNLSGEYVVRIRIHGYPPEGTLTSPIIDMAAEYALSPKIEVSDLRLSADLALQPQTAIRFAVRTGSTAWYAPDKWSPWRAADSANTLPGQRFVQWRATLSSRDARITPLAKKVTIEASGQISGVNHPDIEVIEAPDNAIAVSSYDFDYADPHHPRMRHLREKYRLEEIVAPGKTEMEKFALLRQWVRRQWEGWNENDLQLLPTVGRAGDPRTSSAEPRAGDVYPLCGCLCPVRRGLRVPHPSPHRRPPLPDRDLVGPIRQVDSPRSGASARTPSSFPVRKGRCAHQCTRNASQRRSQQGRRYRYYSPAAHSHRPDAADVCRSVPALRHTTAQRPPVPLRTPRAGTGHESVPLGRPSVVDRQSRPEVPRVLAPDLPAGGLLLVLEQNEDRPRGHRDGRGPVRAIVRPHSQSRPL